MTCSITRAWRTRSTPPAPRADHVPQSGEARATPVVGSVSTDSRGKRAWCRRATAAAVRAICIREAVLVHPRPAGAADHDYRTSELYGAVEGGTRRSPTTVPMLPPRKWKSITASSQGQPPRRASPQRTASWSFVFRCAWRTLSRYDAGA